VDILQQFTFSSGRNVVRVTKNDARLWKPFPLLFCFAITNTALEDTNSATEDTNAALEDL